MEKVATGMPQGKRRFELILLRVDALVLMSKDLISTPLVCTVREPGKRLVA